LVSKVLVTLLTRFQERVGKEPRENRYYKHRLFPLEERVALLPISLPTEGTLPVSKHKRTTSLTPPFKIGAIFPTTARAARISSASASPGGIRAVRTVIELVMREELDAFLGVAWGESSPTRKGYRNGTYTRESFDLDRTAPGPQRAKTIAKGGSTRGSLNATVAMSRTSPTV
jgi:Transposase, Mutator family